MDFHSLQQSLAGCPCGREHTTGITVRIRRGLTPETGALMREAGFSGRLLVVADDHTLAASPGVTESLEGAGFALKSRVYPDMRTADMEQVEEILALCADCDGILSVGSGSLNDICRLAAFRAEKPFAIFATAPSMDGFASNSAPITTDGFKFSHPCKQPDLILADTDILAAAPAELKAAGFGDMIAKYIALADWRVAHLAAGEYYCERVAAVTRQALDTMVSLAGKVGGGDPDTAGAIMEALVLSGVTMQFTGNVRPASGAEHVVSHFWEIKKLEQGRLSDFHGKKVGVATLMIARLYHHCVSQEAVSAHPDATDWDTVYRIYGPRFKADIDRMNHPSCVDETSPDRLQADWPAIRRAIREEVPPVAALEGLMDAAGAVKTPAGIGVCDELAVTGLRYHAYMRYRLTLARLLPMLDIPVDYASFIG